MMHMPSPDSSINDFMEPPVLVIGDLDSLAEQDRRLHGMTTAQLDQ